VRISVGVPAYNQGQYLAETLDSLLNQTVPPDEIVVSDNHSTDETSEVLRRYKERVRVIRPPQHLPMTAHWNYVVENLSGDWFSLLSSDDVAEPGLIQHLSRAVGHQPNAVLARGGWLTISPSGHPTDRCLLWSTSTVTEPPRTFLEQLQGPKATFAAFLCLRSAWEEVGGFPTSLRLYGDWGLWLRLSAVGAFVSTHSVVSRYRTGYPGSRHRARLIDSAHDERVIALEVAARAAQQLGLTRHGVTQRAAARRLTTFLVQASGIASDAEIREQIATELRPLAVATGLEAVLDDFTSGNPLPRPARFRKLASGASVIHAQLRTVGDRFVRLAGRS
jgi:glycosyltransferase involved in cell wall biosynthesis